MKELTITLDPESPLHLYEQIYVYIRDEIRRGNIKKGEKLPSTRALSQFLEISRSTAETAYDQLLSEGYIVSKRGSGFMVAATENLYDLREQTGMNAVRDEDRSLSEPDGTDTGAVRSDEGKDAQIRIDFSPRRIDMSQFPYATWKKICKDNLVDANSEMFSLGEPNGDRSFRETIAHYLHASRGVECDPENLVIGAGNDYLLMLLRTLLAADGTVPVVGMECVTYLRPYRIFRSFGWTVAPVLMDADGMCADSLRDNNCSLAYVMPAHQYPSGTTMPITRRLELLSWAGEGPDRYLIEDDYDSEFRYRGRPIPPLRASDRSDRVIYIGTFSKAIAPAIRVSYMLLPQRLADRYRKELYFLSSTVPRLDQQILGRFIGEGYFERYLNRMRTVYRGKRDVLLDALKPLRKQYEIKGENAGLHVLLVDKTRIYGTPEQSLEKEQELTEIAAKAGVRVYPLSANMLPEKLSEGEFWRPTLLLGYASLTPEEIREGVKLLEGAWKTGSVL